MKVIIEIKETELELKKAVAQGWNKRFDEELTHKDISEVSARDDILSAIPFLDWNKIEVEVEK